MTLEYLMELFEIVDGLVEERVKPCSGGLLKVVGNMQHLAMSVAP